MTNTIRTKFRYGLIEAFSADTVITPALQLYGEWAQAEIDFMSEFFDLGNRPALVKRILGRLTRR